MSYFYTFYYIVRYRKEFVIRKMTNEPIAKKKIKINSIEPEDNSEDTIAPQCPHCSSENVYGISRVVGYFSVIDNWNNSKKSELKRRQKGNYWSKE